MPMFTVKEKGVEKPRLFEAKSREKALEATIAGRFAVDIVSRPADVAKLMAGGVEMEVAETVIADAAKPPVEAETTTEA